MRATGSVIDTMMLNHPGGAVAYRVNYGGHSAVYLTDVEHKPGRIDEEIVAFARHTDIFIYDGMFSDEEFQAHHGWGHSTWQQGARLADAAGVGDYVAIHHAPERSDAELAETRTEAQAHAPRQPPGARRAEPRSAPASQVTSNAPAFDPPVTARAVIVSHAAAATFAGRHQGGFRPPHRAMALPPRVLAAVRRQENSGEVLVKLIQLTVVGLWTVLYLVAPRTDTGTAFSPVPYALGGYMALNIIGLFWALRRGLPNWAVYVNIVLDIAVLTVLIWSFHVQYRQPPSFYLKAPTLLYIFIFIALRALRFQSRFVIVAGLTAAAGWLALTGYAVIDEPGGMMVTHNYVQYMTSNSVLIGAEVDKIISILMVTAILALALKRANDLLVTAVSEEAAARDLSRFFDTEVAEHIRSSDTAAIAGEGVRREAAILFVDIRGFTPMAAELDGGEVVALLAAYERRVVELVKAHGGTIDKFLGDGIMATFGAVADEPAYAADALRAVDALMAEADGWRDDHLLSRIAGRTDQRGGGLGRGAVLHPGRRKPARIHRHRRGGESRRQAGKAQQGDALARPHRQRDVRAGAGPGLPAHARPPPRAPAPGGGRRRGGPGGAARARLRADLPSFLPHFRHSREGGNPLTDQCGHRGTMARQCEPHRYYGANTTNFPLKIGRFCPCLGHEHTPKQVRILRIEGGTQAR